MKSIAFVFALLLSTGALAQTAVNVELKKQDFTLRDTVEFNIAVSSPIELEISVFRPDSLVMIEKSKLQGNLNTYRIPAYRMTPGAYNILISGEGVHEERAIRVVR